MRTIHVSVCIHVSAYIVVVLLVARWQVFNSRRLAEAMASDASRSNNILGLEFYNILSLLVLKLLEHCSAHFHTYCLFCLLWMRLYQDPSRKESVFFKTYLTVVNTAEMPPLKTFFTAAECFQCFFKTHTSRGTSEQSTYNTSSLGNRL